MRRLSNIIISIFVVVIVLFLILPLPTQLMDVLIIINISLSIVILLITMNIADALEFSIFPSLLLVTTLFRLGLNVSSTRLISPPDFKISSPASRIQRMHCISSFIG